MNNIIDHLSELTNEELYELVDSLKLQFIPEDHPVRFACEKIFGNFSLTYQLGLGSLLATELAYRLRRATASHAINNDRL